MGRGAAPHRDCTRRWSCTPALARDGILGAGWPAEYGGTDVDPDVRAARCTRSCARRGLRGARLGADVHGRPHHPARRHRGAEARVPAAPRCAARSLIALGYSEPDAGSDVAAAKTTAVRDGDEWVINGQKMFTSTAQVCSHVFLLTRTNPDVPKHKGLTMFLVPTDSPGFEIQPIHTLGGERTNTTFYTDVRVPDSARIGEVDEGWSVMRVALVYERGGQPGCLARADAGPARWPLGRDARRPDGTAVLDDPLVAERIGRMAVDEEVARLLGAAGAWRAQQGGLPGVEGVDAQAVRTEATSGTAATPSTSSAPRGCWPQGAADAPGGGRFEAEFRGRRGRDDLRRVERDHARDHRRASPRPAAEPPEPMSASVDLLEGFRVLDVSTHGVVPIAGSVLADWGADVIKVEDPEHGDVIRGGTVWGVPPPEGGSSHLYHIFNHGKRCAAINLKHDRGRDALFKIVETSDVFLTSFLTGVRRRLGIDVDDIRARRPDIVYGRNTGRGTKGPNAELGGYDATSFWSRAGLAIATSDPDSRSRRRCRHRRSATARPASRSPPASWPPCCIGSGPAKAWSSTRRCSTPACGRCRRPS